MHERLQLRVAVGSWGGRQRVKYMFKGVKLRPLSISSRKFSNIGGVARERIWCMSDR